MIINKVDTATIGDLVRKVLAGHERTCFIVDDSSFLVGVVSEGDLLRAIWGGINLEAPANDYLNHNPITIPESAKDPKIEAISIFREHGVVSVPVVTSERKLVKVLNIREFI